MVKTLKNSNCEKLNLLEEDFAIGFHVYQLLFHYHLCLFTIFTKSTDRHTDTQTGKRLDF